MKIDLTKPGNHISIVNGYHLMLDGSRWVAYKADAVWTKCISLFFNTLN